MMNNTYISNQRTLGTPSFFRSHITYTHAHTHSTHTQHKSEPVQRGTGSNVLNGVCYMNARKSSSFVIGKDFLSASGIYLSRSRSSGLSSSEDIQKSYKNYC